jgi:hypothetical protein
MRPEDGLPEWLAELRVNVESKPPLIRALLLRSLSAVQHFGSLSEDAAVNASAAPTDLEVLIRALSAPELIADMSSLDPLAPALIRGLQARIRLLNENGGALTAEQVGEILGITRQAVEKRRVAGHLLGVNTGRHGYRYPAWQFTSSGVLPGLQDVLRGLTAHDPWMQTAFFLGKNPRLNDKTPLDTLAEGHVREVLQAAQAFGEHGAA